MRAKYDDPRYLPRPDQAAITKRLEVLGLTAADVRADHLIVRNGESFDFSFDNGAAEPWHHSLEVPDDFLAFKRMVGVPNEVFVKNHTTEYRIYGVSREKLLHDSVYTQLAGRPGSPAYRAALDLLYAYADPELLKDAPYAQLVAAILSARDTLPAVVGKDLIVENGATAKLGDEPVVSFDRIIIHGTGRIDVGDKQKVSANVVQYLES